MRILPVCYDCLERLVELTVSLATSDPDLQERARRASREIIRQEAGAEAIPALIATRFHRVIREITGNPDPFLPRKQQETELLARLYRRVAPDAPPTDLAALLALAATGNALDFFRPAGEVAGDIIKESAFAVSHLEALQNLLDRRVGLLLFLADNAGEQHFDLPLVRRLRNLGWEVVYVVKGGPVQNDLTREDLAASGLLEALAPVADTGAQTVGLILQEASSAFRRLYRRASVIVAKGMGHFETMGRLGDPRLFFLMQAKCAAVAQALDVPTNSFLLLWSRALTAA
jgi:hypothetical protein